MIWYIEDYRRNRREREAIEALVSEVNWLIPVGWRIDSSIRLVWDAFDAVTVCDRMAAASAWLSRNIKSSGKRLLFRFTAWLRELVET
jgi:hypothetical protein